ncbi:MAG: phosphotransferase [Elusimicrobia bacterium]|nr:phosphotransferase [Elusimicrobiota bacterium]
MNVAAQTKEQVLRELFQAHFRESAQAVSAIKSDGSNRELFRITGARRRAVGVIGPDARENRAFIEFSKHFHREGLPVPELYAENAQAGSYLEEDLGDLTLFEYLSDHRGPKGPDAEVVEAYRKVVRILPRFQMGAGRTLDYQFCYPRTGFDRQSMMWDLNYFKYYFLRLSKVPFDEQSLEDDYTRFVDYLLEAPGDFFLYRDFQSRNIMIRGGEPWFIDYQGGRKGALQYDVASLLYDAKADLPPDLRQALLEEYLRAASAVAPFDRARFLKYYPGFVYIRLMQALGAYGLRGFYERKAHFFQSIPYAIHNLEYLLRAAPLPVELPALTQVFQRLVASSYLRQIADVDMQLTVRIQSFSYRDGLPGDDRGHGGGFVFDCRGLPNPGKHERFKKLSGRDLETIAFLEKESAVARFLEHVYGLIDPTIENYRSRNFTDLMVSFGCTGGRHRSVYCAELLAKHLREKYDIRVEVNHRGLSEAPEGPLSA